MQGDDGSPQWGLALIPLVPKSITIKRKVVGPGTSSGFPCFRTAYQDAAPLPIGRGVCIATVERVRYAREARSRLDPLLSAYERTRAEERIFLSDHSRASHTREGAEH